MILSLLLVLFIGRRRIAGVSQLSCSCCVVSIFNSSSPGQNGGHFADDMFKRIFLSENI